MSIILKGPEWNQLLSKLEEHFAIFGTLYSISRPIFSEEIPTAGVYFNKAGNCIDFKVNPKFWEALSFDEKLFVMSHEALHVFLRHGVRLKNLAPEERERANYAVDVVVNHLLTDKFQFDRKKIDPKDKWCWLDKVFKDRVVKRNQNFEYYLNLLREKSKGGGGGGGKGKSSKEYKGSGEATEGELVNDHSNLDSFGNKKEKEEKKSEGKKSSSKPSENSDAKEKSDFKDFLKKFGKAELEELADKLKDSSAGTDAGDLVKIMEEIRIPPKRKWETIIKKWSHRFLTDADDDQFVTTNRRYVLFKSDDTFLPTSQEREEFDKNRIDVWFFQDTSGSCSHLAERLFRAGQTLPKQRFNVKFHCFDTRVYEVDPVKRELKGFGGTSFSCIEQYIQQKLAEKPGKYPTCFILTDGDGDRVTPQMPERWHWFLTYNHRYYVPAKSSSYMLEDFE